MAAGPAAAAPQAAAARLPTAAGPAATTGARAADTRAGRARSAGRRDLDEPVWGHPLEDPAYRAQVRRGDRARSRAWDRGAAEGSRQARTRRVGRLKTPEISADPELQDLAEGGARDAFRAERRAARRRRVEPLTARAGDLVGDGSVAVLMLLGYALLINYLRGGTGQVRGWLAAKFFNRPYGSPPAASPWFTAAGYQPSAGGGLLLPVPGGMFSDTFGAARPGGRRHEGLDIFAPRGSRVIAAASGVVQPGMSNPLGGVVVRVTGDDGNRYYYAHLQPGTVVVQPGEYVRTGQLLAGVGTSGNAASTAPHLHFGIYVDGRAIDPYPLLAVAA